MRFIDLSVGIEDGAISEPFPAHIHYITHSGEGLEIFRRLFGVSEKDLVYSEGKGGAWEEITAITHTATHLDAPYHFGETSEGRPARTIDQVPLEWCFSDGVVLDLRHKRPGELITVEDLKAALEKIGYRIKPLDIVLLMTGCDKKLGSPDYFEQPGMGREATLWLVGQGVKVIGIDAYGFDRRFSHMAEDFRRTGDGRVVWPAHFAGITREYCHIEKLANLDQLPPFGFKVACFPIKVARGSAGWCRAVAIIED